MRSTGVITFILAIISVVAATSWYPNHVNYALSRVSESCALKYQKVTTQILGDMNLLLIGNLTRHDYFVRSEKNIQSFKKYFQKRKVPKNLFKLLVTQLRRYISLDFYDNARIQYQARRSVQQKGDGPPTSVDPVMNLHHEVNPSVYWWILIWVMPILGCFFPLFIGSICCSLCLQYRIFQVTAGLICSIFIFFLLVPWKWAFLCCICGIIGGMIAAF
jgi:hypothetical protein